MAGHPAHSIRGVGKEKWKRKWRDEQRYSSLSLTRFLCLYIPFRRIHLLARWCKADCSHRPA